MTASKAAFLKDKPHCFDALKHIIEKKRKKMFKRHIHETTIGQSCMHNVPQDKSSIKVTTISQLSGKHIRIPDITPFIQYTEQLLL